jgi:hypothetical protein
MIRNAGFSQYNAPKVAFGKKYESRKLEGLYEKVMESGGKIDVGGFSITAKKHTDAKMRDKYVVETTQTLKKPRILGVVSDFFAHLTSMAFKEEPVKQIRKRVETSAATAMGASQKVVSGQMQPVFANKEFQSQIEKPFDRVTRFFAGKAKNDLEASYTRDLSDKAANKHLNKVIKLVLGNK